MLWASSEAGRTADPTYHPVVGSDSIWCPGSVMEKPLPKCTKFQLGPPYPSLCLHGSMPLVSDTAHRLGLQHWLPSLLLLLPHRHGLRGRGGECGPVCGLGSGSIGASSGTSLNAAFNSTTLFCLGGTLSCPSTGSLLETPWCWLSDHSHLLRGVVHTLRVLGGPTVVC